MHSKVMRNTKGSVNLAGLLTTEMSLRTSSEQRRANMQQSKAVRDIDDTHGRVARRVSPLAPMTPGTRRESIELGRELRQLCDRGKRLRRQVLVSSLSARTRDARSSSD